MPYVVGLIMIAVAVAFIVKTEWWVSAFGRVTWAEQNLGAEGGTRIFYKLLGFGLIILAFMIMSGRIFTVLDWVFVRGN
ncbi:MAG: hypothetical protein WCW27_05235 [Patescibacteria group bacterium]|jgi:hypothetical protein